MLIQLFPGTPPGNQPGASYLTLTPEGCAERHQVQAILELLKKAGATVREFENQLSEETGISIKVETQLRLGPIDMTDIIEELQKDPPPRKEAKLLT